MLLRRGLACLGLIILLVHGAENAAADGPIVVVVDDETRVRRADAARALERGQRVSAAGAEVALTALRGETVACQIVVVAGAGAVTAASVRAADLRAPAGGPPLRPQLFREHYLPITERSHNERWPEESLGWTRWARPPDSEMLGEMPDALIPVELDARPVMAGPAVPSGQTGAFWVDVHVPEDVPAGLYRGDVEVTGDGATLARFALGVDVKPARLPFRAQSVFAFYEAERLPARMGPDPQQEAQLWRLLHQHHIDALPTLARAADVERLRPMLDGSLFTQSAGYGGPGPGQAPLVTAVGAYAALGDPSPETVQRAEEVAARLPAPPRGPADVFLYAVDERCASPRAADWKRALEGRPIAGRVRVGHSCADPPETQAADVVLIPGGSLARAAIARGRAAGKKVWGYNGGLPHAGTLSLDADPRGLIANGWIAALADVERWFYWETIFWNDDNDGGHGPIDPFATPATFHNGDGDTNLSDGILLYPGRQVEKFAAHSLGFAGVLPSLRLKAIRRGIEDAGYLGLAAAVDPAAAARIGREAVPRLLDEAPVDAPASWEGVAGRFPRARAELRAIILNAPAPAAPDLRRVFADLGERRRREVRPALPRRKRLMLQAGGAGAGGVVVIAAVALLVRRRRARER